MKQIFSFIILLLVFWGFLGCKPSDEGAKSGTTTTATSTTAPSSTSNLQVVLSGPNSLVVGTPTLFTLTFSGQPNFLPNGIRITWQSIPAGILFSENSSSAARGPYSHIVTQSTQQVTIWATASQAGTYEILASVIDSSNQQAYHSIANISAAGASSGGATGITGGPISLIISGPTAVIANQTTSYTYSVAAPAYFVGPFMITWSSDDAPPVSPSYIYPQLVLQTNTLSVNIIAEPRRTFQFVYNFTLYVTIIDSSSPPQAATGNINVKVCTFSPC